MSSTISAGTTAGTAISVSGDTSGQLVLQTNGTTTAVTISTGQVVTLAQPLPVASGGSGVTTSTGTGAVVLGTSPTITGAVMSTMASSVITAGTAVASTSGTSIDFTGIPSWAKRVTVMFSGVSTSGTSLPMIQLGDSGGIETTGYTAGSSLLAPASIGTSNYTTGFTFRTDALASIVMDGFITINLVSSSTNTWVAGGTIYAPTPSAYMAAVAGAKSLSATLDRVRLTTVGGSDTFDAGSLNILYE